MTRLSIHQTCKRTERFNNLGYDVVYEVNDSVFEKKWTFNSRRKRRVRFCREIFREIYKDNYIVRSADIYLEVIPKKY